LGMVGRRVDSLRIFGRRRTEDSPRLWRRWAHAVMARPWVALIGTVAVVGLLAFPARNLVLGSSGPSILPADSTARQAADITAGAFGAGAVSPIQMVYADPRGVTGDGLEGLLATVGAIAEDPDVVRVDFVLTPLLALNPGATADEARQFLASPLSADVRAQLVAADGDRTLVAIVTTHGPQTAESDATVERLRALVPPVLPEGASAALGGSPGLNLDLNDEVQRQIIPVVALVMILSFVLLMLFFRSLLLPLKAILMNTASVVAAYGVLVFVFQEGHWEGLLGFRSNGHIESFLPLFLFSTLFGLSMDYEVFLLARVREEYLRTGDNTEAVGWGLEHTARIITSAAAIMVTVFGAFAFARLLPIKTMGFGLAVAVLLDATLIRVIMVPATMRLMGRWNWWLPKWLDRILPKVSVEESAPSPDEEKVAAPA
ncbi:MAG TPA: MMPL family transporter, partial [Actinomycetota bacterium]|nr:MMPL family transporter [Actinomycetota bacterium]